MVNDKQHFIVVRVKGTRKIDVLFFFILIIYNMYSKLIYVIVNFITFFILYIFYCYPFSRILIIYCICDITFYCIVFFSRMSGLMFCEVVIFFKFFYNHV